jgi:CRP/FNR family transcriptional regulator, cyclic AMP receptor protein
VSARPSSSGGAAAARAADAEDFWSSLDGDATAALTGAATVRTFARGQALLHSGQVADRVLILRAGRAKVTTAAESGREVVLAFRGPGALVGEQSALDGLPRAASIVAVERVEALSLSAEAFRAFLAAHPGASLSLLAMLSRRLRQADAKRLELAAFTTIERVAGELLELAGRFGSRDGGSIRIDLPISQEELAGATGASIESVGRALQTLRSLRCIETRRREIRVLDVDALAALRSVAG